MLAIIAALSLQVVLHDRMMQPLAEWLHVGFAVALAFALRWTERIAKSRLRAVLWLLGFVVLFGFPFVGDALQRELLFSGSPFEIQLALGLRNMMFGLAATSRHERSLRLASLASCFLMLFSILWLMNGWNIGLLFAYAMVGMWWLAGAYWSRISDCLLSDSQRTVPWQPLCGTAILGLIALGLLMPLAIGVSYTTAFEGFLPSSGGTRWRDDHAFGGVGDGTQLVSAKEDASSFGPIETDLFLESEMPSIYDCFNEFAEPAAGKKNKIRSRAIPLAPTQFRQNHEKKGVNQKPGREFETVRKKKPRQKKSTVNDLRSSELLQVAGRVPVHLGMYTYDLWDGRALSSSNRAGKRSLYLESRTDVQNWVRCSGVGEDALLSHREQHELRIINLKTERVPSPPCLIGAHVDRLHSDRLFEMTQDGMLAFDMECIPQLSVIHVESFYRRHASRPVPIKSDSPAKDQCDAISNLAESWTKDMPQGWAQVEALRQRLREDYVLDPAAMVPEGVDDAVVHFLTKSRRGPDYLFAASAAMLLRSRGYEARVVSGFYAKPENYDRQARLTSVFAEDAHFWVEVLAKSVEEGHPEYTRANSHWFAIEPSPGYEVLYAPESFLAALRRYAGAIWHAIQQNSIVSLAVCAVGILLWLTRAWLCDLAITNWWRLHFHWGDTRHRVIATLRLLDRRAGIYGRSRAKENSLGRWRFLLDSLNSRRQKRFLAVANCALYGGGRFPDLFPDQSGDDISLLCSEIASSAFQRGQPERTVGVSRSEEPT
jgi:hypothetical protein